MNLASLFRWRRRRAPGAGAPGAVNPPGEAERLLRRLDFTVIRRLDGLRQGDHRNAAYGAGLDLAELRPYQPGDDVRALDWNVTARMGEAYVRRYNEDRDVTAWLVLDLTASTDFGSALQTKRDLAIDVAGTLARLLTGRGDRVGALLYTGSPITRRRGRRERADLRWGEWQRREPERRPAEFVAAGAGRTYALQLLRRTLDAVERAQGASRSGDAARRQAQTDLAALLEQAFRTARQRSLVFILSDFLDGAALPPPGSAPRDPPYLPAGRPGGAPAPALGWEAALGPLARRHEVVGVWIRDPREMGLPDVGVVTFEDGETGEQLAVDTSQPSLRAAYASLAAARQAEIEHAFARHNAALWQLSTAEPLVPALVRFLEQRRRTLLGAQRLLQRTA